MDAIPPLQYDLKKVLRYLGGSQIGPLRSGNVQRDCLNPGEKEYTPPPWHPSFLGPSPSPEVTEQKSYGVYPFSWENKGKKGYTPIGPERRVYTIEPQTRKKKRRVSTVVGVYFFLPCDYVLVQTNLRKILAPIKIKIGTPPPPKPKIPPPPKRGILWTWVFPAERAHFSRRP